MNNLQFMISQSPIIGIPISVTYPIYAFTANMVNNGLPSHQYNLNQTVYDNFEKFLAVKYSDKDVVRNSTFGKFNCLKFFGTRVSDIKSSLPIQ